MAHDRMEHIKFKNALDKLLFYYQNNKDFLYQPQNQDLIAQAQSEISAFNFSNHAEADILAQNLRSVKIYKNAEDFIPTRTAPLPGLEIPGIPSENHSKTTQIPLKRFKTAKMVNKAGLMETLENLRCQQKAVDILKKIMRKKWDKRNLSELTKNVENRDSLTNFQKAKMVHLQKRVKLKSKKEKVLEQMLDFC